MFGDVARHEHGRQYASGQYEQQFVVSDRWLHVAGHNRPTLSIISSCYMWKSKFLLYCQLLIIAYIRLLIIVLN